MILINVITILTASSHFHYSPLTSLHHLITGGHHSEFPLDDTHIHTSMHTHIPQWHNSAISTFNCRTPTIHSCCLHSRYITPSRPRTSLTLLLTHVSLTLFTLSHDCTSNKDISKMPSYTTRTFPPTYLDDALKPHSNIPTLISRTFPPSPLEH